MDEEHLYGSRLELGRQKYDVAGAKDALVEYLKKEARIVFNYDNLPRAELRGFHKDGISIHLQTAAHRSNEISFVNVGLVSDVTPTKDLEDRLQQVADQFKLE